MKILNLYAGIGGNRKLWPNDCEITAVEINPKIADVYQRKYPEDKVVIGDAHQYLLDHLNDGWNLIWSSRPCVTHSDIRRCAVHAGKLKPIYPDMVLYEEIILLQNFAPIKTKYVVENVIPYYTPLLPAQRIGRHLFWANFIIEPIKQNISEHLDAIGDLEKVKEMSLDKSDLDNKRQVLRNCVHPKLGLHVFNCAFRLIQTKIKETN